MWSIRGTGGKELTTMIRAVFSKQNFPNQSTWKPIAGTYT